MKASSNNKFLFTVVVALLFFLSGFASLVYQILWMRELGLLFGVTAYAAATTTAAFFLGLGIGSAFFGSRSNLSKRPLLTYGLLELGISITALLFFGLTHAYRGIYPALFDWLVENRAAFLIVKFLLAVVILFPPAFLMGGTLPVVSRFLTHGLNQEALGQRVPLFYGINTFGAATGALIAGFFLPQWLGISGSYWLAIGLTAFVGIAAIGSSLKIEKQSIASDSAKSKSRLSLPKSVTGLAFFSGFSTLALEVLWTRMFSQTLQNSVYSYAIILVTFLIALAIGSWIASALARKFSAQSASRVLVWLLLSAGLFTLLSPTIFHQFASDKGGYLGDTENWSEYLRLMFLSAGITVFPATIALGTVFPFLLKLLEKQGRGDPGQIVGRLAAINTAGAVLGSVAAGFAMLDWFGLWSSIRLLAICYLLLVFAYSARWFTSIKSTKVAVITALLCLFIGLTWLDPVKLPNVYHSPIKRKETILKVTEGSDATVAVIRRKDDVRLKVNNFYVLGSSGASETSERFQSHLPLVIHPNPKNVFYLGMGTGITASGALDIEGIEKITVAELLPSVVEAAKEFFKPWLNGLFEDERVTVIAEDGRNVLSATRINYDVVISDLFLPWRSGVGSLYSVDYYYRAKERLNDGGIYAQWIPLYQVSESELAIIANSMQQAFPTVTMWRGDFSASHPAVCLVGHKESTPLNWSTFEQRSIALNAKLDINQQPPFNKIPGHLTYYAGNLTASKLMNDAPLNTDNFPLIEYSAPVTHRAEKAGEETRFIGKPMLLFYDKLTLAAPIKDDPWLANAPQHAAQIAEAGHTLQELSYAKSEKDQKAQTQAMRTLQQITVEISSQLK